MNYAETLCSSMERIVEGVLSGISYDKTVTCTITDNSKREQGEYTVTDGSTKFIAYSENTTYLKDAVVYVTIPEGNYDNPKVIVSKKTSNDSSEPFIYKAPLADFLDVSGNLYNGKRTEGLTANYEEENEKLLINNQNLIGYKSFTRFGVKADFKSWLEDMDCVSGDYGLKIILTFLPECIYGLEVNDDLKYDLTLYLNTQDMIGNPYGFNSFYSQEKLFDISGLGTLKGIKVYFYQDLQFKNKNGELIPYMEGADEGFTDSILNSNLFVQDIYLYTGYELSSYDTDFILLYSFDDTTYTNKNSSVKTKNVKLKWVHIDEQKNCIDMEDQLGENFEIRWYQYKLGEPSADEYSGVYWVRINQENIKSFNCTLNLDIYKSQTEQVKAIAIYKGKFYTSNILVFTNDEEVVNDATIDALKALNLVCKDIKNDLIYNSSGNYYLYDENNSLIDKAQTSILRSIECHLNLQGTELADGMSNVTAEDSITWIIPNKNTMIKFDDVESEEDEIVVKYEGDDINKHKRNGYPCIDYRIKNYFSSSFLNNTIQCIVKKNGITYTAAKELSFGLAGTTGTDFTFVLDIDEISTAFTKGTQETFNITARLYDSLNIELSLEGKTINWDWFKKPSNSHINIITNETKLYKAQLLSLNSLDMNEIYILMATMSNWGDYTMTAYLPIPIRANNNYLNITGATQVIYLTDGLPKYYNNEYIIYGNTIKEIENITWKTLYETALGKNPTNSEKEKYDNLISYLPGLKVYDETKYILSPTSMYIDGLPGFAVLAYQGNNIIWTLPVLIILNRYPSAMLNKWNGKELELGDNHILASMIGAGKKDAEDNSFSGVLIGDLKGKIASDINATDYTGVFGFDKGVMSYSFTDDGRATIGKATGSQLIFDGKESTITSKSYNDSSSGGLKLDFDDGLISSKYKGVEIFKIDNENPYLVIKTPNSDSNSSKTLMLVSDGNYYLQSYNFNDGTNAYGIKLDLSGNTLESKFNGKTVFKLNGSSSSVLSILGKNQTLMNVGSESYYLLSDNYGTEDEKKIKNGMHINLLTGQLYARSADIRGTITADNLYANSGTIAGWTIGADGLYKSSSLRDEDILLISNSEGTIFLGKNKIYVKGGAHTETNTTGGLGISSELAISLDAKKIYIGSSTMGILMDPSNSTMTIRAPNLHFETSKGSGSVSSSNLQISLG